jgi:hypothetical protein
MYKVYKIILMGLFLVSFLNLLFTFGYQGAPMSQIEFLARTLGSIVIGGSSILILITKFEH